MTGRATAGVALVLVLVAGAVPPAGAAELGHGSPVVRTAAPRPATPGSVPTGTGADGDGLTATTHRVALEDGAAGAVALVEEPEMVIVEGLAPHAELEVRSRNHGEWSEWIHVHSDNGDAPDGAPGEEGAGSAPTSVGPIWLGRGADRLELSVEHGGQGPVRVTGLELTEARTVDESQPMGVRAAAVAAVPSAAPFIHLRSSWATEDMGWATQNSGCEKGPNHGGDVQAMVVHHTAGTNSYSAADVRGIIRGIWYYHVQSRGWCDIAYNFLVDRFGNVFEGRQGGITEEIIGGHTYGHNTETSGVAQLGDFDTATAPYSMTVATAKLVGWKLGIHGISPTGRSRLTNRAPDHTPAGLPPDESVDVPSVLGHRDLGNTSCPGASTYARLPGIRSEARLGAHVAVLHDTFLGRPPRHEQYGAWYGYARQNGLEATARTMTRTAAYAGPRIDELYRTVLGRDPDPAGRADWISRIQSGVMLRTVSIGFYASRENYRRTGGTPEGFVTSLYRDILHREPDPHGLADWSRQIREGTGLTRVVSGFYGSIESRRDRVTRLYRSILDREPDPTGFATWTRYLSSRDDLELAATLTGSDEYYARNLA